MYKRENSWVKIQAQSVASTKLKEHMFTSTATTSSVPKAFTAPSLKLNTVLKKKGEEWDLASTNFSSWRNISSSSAAVIHLGPQPNLHYFQGAAKDSVGTLTP